MNEIKYSLEILDVTDFLDSVFFFFEFVLAAE